MRFSKLIKIYVIQFEINSVVFFSWIYRNPVVREADGG